MNRACRTSLFLLLSFLLLPGCGKTVLDQSNDLGQLFSQSSATHYFKSSEKVIVEVHYEPGAEPFAGQTAAGRPYWQILEDNLKAVFKFRANQPVVIVPKVISEMNAMPLQNKSTWTADDILNLNKNFKIASPTTSEARFYVYFVNGNYSESNNVIGISVNGTPVIGIFKNVITSSGGFVVQRYVEQSTIIHELGHALGFVNSGVPMKTPHQDTAHGSHTTNPDCVMYWQNEGKADLMNFVGKFISSGNNIMWGPEVLADAEAFSK